MLKTRFIKFAAMMIAMNFFITHQAYALQEFSRASAQPASTSGFVKPSLEKTLLQDALSPVNDAEKVTSKNFAEYHPRVYYFTPAQVPAVKVFAVHGSYESFELAKDGNFGRRLETGLYEKGNFIRTRLYDYQTLRLIISNPRNLFEKRIYELKENGEAGRPLEYRGRNEAGNLVNVRFLYDDANGTVTCLHIRNMSYTVYRLDEFHRLGSLLEIGTAATIRAGRVYALRSIKISFLERDGEMIPVYIFHNNGAFSTQTVRERIVREGEELGVIGRVLEYEGPAGEMEYRYNGGMLNPRPTVSITNRRTGLVLELEIPQTVLNETHGRLTASKSRNHASVTEGVHDYGKIFKMLPAGIFIHGMQGGLVFDESSQFFSRQVWRGYLRGPPSFSQTFLETVLGFRNYSSHFTLLSFLASIGGRL